MVTPKASLPVGALALVMILALVGCGSQLDPDQVVGAGGVVQPGSGAGTVAPADGATGTTGDSGAGGGGGNPGATTGGGDGASTGSGATGGSGGSTGSGGGSATAGTKAGSCDGFKNQTGITSDTIKLGNSSDISGPIPGLFASAQQGAKAYIAYFNSSSNVCGRKLALDAYDTHFDAGGDQVNYTKMCSGDFAAVGSMSALDSGGASTAAGCGLPDMRAVSTSPSRQSCKTCFAALASGTKSAVGIAKFFSQRYPAAVKKVAMIYGATAVAQAHTEVVKRGYESLGWKVVYTAGIDPAEFNYSPYVQQLKDKGVQLVYFTGGAYQQTVKMQQAIAQQPDYKKPLYLQDPLIYDQNYVREAGAAGDGTFVYVTHPLFDDTSNKQMVLYRTWLQQTSPGASPTYFGLYAWSASELAVENMVALGGKLNRASLVASIAKVNDWTAHGLHVAQPVASKGTAPCVNIIQLKGGKWQYAAGRSYMCQGVV